MQGARAIAQPLTLVAVRAALIQHGARTPGLEADLMGAIWASTFPIAPVGYVPAVEHELVKAKLLTAQRLLEVAYAGR